jgi:4-amino-4-deoxy-L-arabinose transferase-like glycosyltransferase
MLHKIRIFITRHKIEVAILIGILIIASFMRLYRISDYMTFLGDEGRDAIVAREILHGNFTLLGPRASAGDFFLGPIYYYMMAPFLLLTYYDPVGPAIMVALFGIATVFLVYYVGRRFFDPKSALIAAGLYSIAPLVIAYSRSSWNPNPMPFFSLLMLFLLYEGVKGDRKILFLVVGLLLGIAMQLHYLSTFLGAIIFFFVIFGEFLKDRKKFIIKSIYSYLLIATGFIGGLLPFLFFEARHGFPNIRTITSFVFETNSTTGYVPGSSFGENIYDVFFRLFTRVVVNYPAPNMLDHSFHLNLEIWKLGAMILAICSIIVLMVSKEKLKVLLLMLWLVVGVSLFGLYRRSIYDYYLGFLFPLPFLLIGNLISRTFEYHKKMRLGAIIASGALTIIVVLNLLGVPFRYPANKQKDQAKRIADFILSKTNHRPYNFALLTNGNSDHVYRYFLEVANQSPITIENTAIDPERKSVTDQLIVVCERPTCSPLGDPLWEVAGFGRAEIKGEWEVPYVKIYRLEHFKPQ